MLTALTFRYRVRLCCPLWREKRGLMLGFNALRVFPLHEFPLAQCLLSCRGLVFTSIILKLATPPCQPNPGSHSTL